MEITVTIPDDFAAQVVARGVSPERYVEGLIAEQARAALMPSQTRDRAAKLESFLEEMVARSEKVPMLSEEALTRESFYQDRD